MVSQDNTQDHSFPSYHVLTVLNRKQRPLQTTGVDLDEWNSEEWCGGEVTFWKIGPSKKFVNRKRKVKSEKQILTSTRPSNASKYDRTWLRGHKSETISLLISISLSVKEYIGEKWDWDQKWDRLTFMAPEPGLWRKYSRREHFNTLGK